MEDDEDAFSIVTKPSIDEVSKSEMRDSDVHLIDTGESRGGAVVASESTLAMDSETEKVAVNGNDLLSSVVRGADKVEPDVAAVIVGGEKALYASETLVAASYEVENVAEASEAVAIVGGGEKTCTDVNSSQPVTGTIMDFVQDERSETVEEDGETEKEVEDRIDDGERVAARFANSRLVDSGLVLVPEERDHSEVKKETYAVKVPEEAREETVLNMEVSLKGSDFAGLDNSEMVFDEVPMCRKEEHDSEALAAEDEDQTTLAMKSEEFMEELKASEGAQVPQLHNLQVDDGLLIMANNEKGNCQMDNEEIVDNHRAENLLEAEFEINVETEKTSKLSGSGAVRAAERDEYEEASDHKEIPKTEQDEIPTEKQEEISMAGEEDIATADGMRETEEEVEVEAMRDDEGEPVTALYYSEVLLSEEEGEAVASGEKTGICDEEMGTETDAADNGKDSGEKRKRGRSSKSPSSSKAVSVAPARKKRAENVCFICFGSGNLVFCDRRGCPKAYHPSCVNIDDAFLLGKDSWNCGWHLCSTCQKNARYMCYTCPFALCKGCIKGTAIFCVRGNKGFCETCMTTVMLIENKKGSKEALLDFDDKSKWEFLFKDYYVKLKKTLSLSSVEIANAKNPWKGSDASDGKQRENKPYWYTDNNGGSGSEYYTDVAESNISKRRKVKTQQRSSRKDDDSTSAGIAISDEGSSRAINTEWASKELLEFVMHMKNGDASVLSQFDVQAMLLEYIKTNKLRDPRRKSQIICDSRLQNLFGKARVGHFEMLKLLESHFLINEDSQTDDAQGTVVNAEVDQTEGDTDVDTPTKGIKDGRRKTRKKGVYRGPQSNLDDYAAIDVHNISLIFLKRKLVEDLLEDEEKFIDKVVGTFVRIRISGCIQKQDLYRLVPVISTRRAAKPYKVGKRTTDILLEILNLNKTEVVSIDTISHQEFTEEECKRLRQSIKCGLIKRLTVGDILDKAMEVQTARVNDWLESEIMRLSHLRDRASEKGRKKELRECVEKLQVLKTPEERQRRLEEAPEIHDDPNMDPNYESADEDSGSDDNKLEFNMGYRDLSFGNRGREPISPKSNVSPKDSWSGAGKTFGQSSELNRNLAGNNILNEAEGMMHDGDMASESSRYHVIDRDVKESKPSGNQLLASKLESLGQNSSAILKSVSFPGVVSVSSHAPLSSEVMEATDKINETEKIWHYQDPAGKVQGPFSVVQLRKWSNSRYFPADLRIWRTSETRDESMLLTDALAGRIEKKLSTSNSRILTSGVPSHDSVKTSVRDETSNIDQKNLQGRDASKGVMTPSAGASELSAKRWVGSVISKLPSPAPKQENVAWTGERAATITGSSSYTAYSGVIQSPLAFGDIGNNSSSSEWSHANSSQLSASALTNEAHKPVHQSHPPNAPDIAIQPIQSTNIHSTNLETSGPVSGLPLKVEPNPSNPVSGQPQAHVNWAGNISSVQNPTSNFANPSACASQADSWRPETQVNQPNVQPNVPWGPDSLNAGWVAMQGYPGVDGWGTATGNMNTNWGTAMQPGPGNSCWTMPAANPGASQSGPTPGNATPWVASTGNPGIPCLPGGGNINPGWVTPPGMTGPTVQGLAPGNTWAPPAGYPSAQGLPLSNANQGWSGPSTQNMRGNGSGFGGSRPGDRQSSFGRGRPGAPRRFRQMVCPYNTNGRCRKGADCDYVHI